ncbi:MAG: RluA family pseudouridine synthase [Desulfobacterales bacterium]
MTRVGPFRLPVGPSDAGRRLDVFVAERLPSCSRSFAAQLIAAGAASVDGKDRKPGHRVKAGEIVTVSVPAPRPSGFLPEPIPLDILYEDEHLVVVNKPAGLVVHPAPGHCSGTLVNALLHHCPDLTGIGAELRPGIVHRLDKDTSGTLVAAKNAPALDRLSAQFKARTVGKDYLALVHGRMAEEVGAIRLPIGRHPVDRKRMSTRSRSPREAETDWRVERRFGDFSLLRVHLRTGRTHQIRVHCAAIHHPVVGDPVYAPRRALPALLPVAVRSILAGVRRQMLHAWRLEFSHPVTGERLRFESPPPADMLELIAALAPVAGEAPEGG